MKITDVVNPRWADMSKKSIALAVRIDGQPGTFVASATDTYPHGRVLFEKAFNGFYGAVAPFVAGETE